MSETLADQIARDLRRDILRGKFQPGSPLKERENASEMGVSRTPMREAIRILAKEGLIELRPSRSPTVAAPDLKDVQDNTVVLAALEELSGQLAITHASDAQLAHIVKLNERIEKTKDEIDRFERDMAFHLAIAEASGNRALANTHQTYMQRMWRVRFLTAGLRRNRDAQLAQHQSIVEALLARDAQATAIALRDHLANFDKDVHQVYLQQAQGQLDAAQ